MNSRKWLALITVFVLAVVGAVAISTLRSPYRTLYPDSAAASPDTAATVAFPADYRQRFIPYAIVDCPNSRMVRKMYVSPITLDALQAGEPAPSGTVIVMETHAARQSQHGRLQPTRINNVFIREKRSGWQVNARSSDWKSAWYSPDGRLVSGSQQSCIGCHHQVRDLDYLFTLPALQAAAESGEQQRQTTEFGTSVCR